MELRSRLSDRQCRVYSAVAVAVLGAASLGTAVLQSNEATTPVAESSPLGAVPVEHAPAEEFTPSPGLEGVDLLAPQDGVPAAGAAVPGMPMLPSAMGPAAGMNPAPAPLAAAPAQLPAFPAPAPAPAPLAAPEPAPLASPPPPAQLPAAPAGPAAGADPAPAGGFQQTPQGGFQQEPAGAAQTTPGVAPQPTTAAGPDGTTGTGQTTEPPRRTGGAVGLLGLN